MSVRDALLPAIETIRTIPKLLGLRQTQVLIRTRTWSGGETGQGTKSDADVEIGAGSAARPLVRDTNDGNFQISRITPALTGGGWHPSQLMPDQPPGTETYIVLVVDSFTRECRIVDCTLRPPFGYVLIVSDRE